MGAGVHLCLFGIPELRDPAGGVVRLRTRKQLALLIYLALEARAHPASRDQLVQLFWSDVPEAKARHSLSQALTAIRGALGGDPVKPIGGSVLFTGSLTTDLDVPTWTDSGVDLAHPLRALETCAGPDFAHWVDAARERCRKAARGLLAEAIERARSSGDVAAVHERAETLYAVDCSSDVAAQALAERALLEGDPAGAIRFLRDHLKRSEEELGCAPHPDIKRLLRRIESGTPGPAPQAEPPILDQPLVRKEVFVGREAELAQLEAAWAEARRGSFQTCLVTGPAGIGKSSLVRRFATTVTARGAPVLMVTCQEIGAAIPFAATADLIRELARDPSLGGTDPMWLAEASRVYPALRSTYPGIPDPPQAPGESIRFRLGEALFRMTETVADEGAVLIVFDDLQHLDPASREVLHVLARRLEAEPALLVGAARTLTIEPTATTADGTSPIAWDGSLTVAPLGPSQVLQLIARESREDQEPAQRIRDQIVTLAQGNPYFAEMLLQDWRRHASASLAAAEASGDRTAAMWRPPETMRAAFARQFEGLASDAREMLDALAIAGRGVTPRELAGVLGWERARAGRATLALMDHGVARFEGGDIAFKNELHRAYVYYAMSEDVRKYGHAKLAESLKSEEGSEDFQRMLEQSHHFLRAGMAAKAVEAVQVGAELAISHGAPREGDRALTSLIAAFPDSAGSKLHLLLAQALAVQGRYPDALDALSRWTPMEKNRLDVAVATKLRAGILRLGRLADDRTIAEASNHAVAAARLTRDSRAIISALQVQAEVATDVSDLQTLMRVERRACGIIASSPDLESQALAELTRGYCLMVLSETQQALEAFSASAELLDSLSLDTELRRALNGVGICSTDLGRYEQASAALQRAIKITQRTGDAHYGCLLWYNLAAIHENRGFFIQAAESYRKAMELGRTSATPRIAALLHASAGWFAVLLGNLEQGRDLLARADAAAERAHLWTYNVKIMLTRADLHLALREPELAWPFVEQAVQRTRGQLYTSGEVSGLLRLRTHWVWATRGYEAMAAETASLDMHRVRAFDRYELLGLLEWIDQQEGKKESTHSAVLTKLQARGLLGTIALLVAVHTCPRPLPEPSPEESSAQLVARIFPDPARGTPPHEIPVPR